MSNQVIESDGVWHVPAIEVPPSTYISDSAARNAALHQRIDLPLTYSMEAISSTRRALEELAEPLVRDTKRLFAAHVSKQIVAGVPIRIVTPINPMPEENTQRALIELHAGAFVTGTEYGIAESLAVSAIGQVKVVSVDYRLAPEYSFPAASEDVSKVYMALLETYPPTNIGIFGSSAGGLLAAEAVVWFGRQGLPRPGAIGMLGSGADARFDGDSRYTNPASGYGVKPEQQIVEFMLQSYFRDANLRDPLISPAWSLDALEKFPPVILISSTRAHELSSVIFTHQQLLKAGIPAELRLWDGLPHCFYLAAPHIPESREVFETLTNFFQRHLTCQSR